MHLKSIVQIVSSLLFAALLSGCGREAEVNFYDKSLKEQSLECLQFNPKNNSNLEQNLEKLYHFNNRCKYNLELSYKSDIVCTSPYNAALKNTTNFPNAYIKLEVRNGMRLLYSYYKDLSHKPTVDDLKEAFERLKDDIL